MHANGIVKWFNDAKGFGFIEPDGGGGDVFAHYSAIDMNGFRTLRQGSRVAFELVDGPKGRMAQHIQPLDANGEPLPAASPDEAAAAASASAGAVTSPQE